MSISKIRVLCLQASLLIIVVIVLTGCQGTSFAPTVTPVATATLTETVTPSPSSTPTFTSTPTATPTPTVTPTPTLPAIGPNNWQDINVSQLVGYGPFRKVSWSRDGNTVVISFLHSFLVLDAKTWKPLLQIKGLYQLTNAILNEDGTVVLVGKRGFSIDDTGVLYLWQRGSTEDVFPEEPEEILLEDLVHLQRLIPFADGTGFYAGGWMALQAYSFDLQRLPNKDLGINGRDPVEISPKGKYFLKTSPYGNSIEIYDGQTGEELSYRGTTSEVYGVDFLSDENLVSYTEKNHHIEVLIWNVPQLFITDRWYLKGCRKEEIWSRFDIVPLDSVHFLAACENGFYVVNSKTHEERLLENPDFGGRFSSGYVFSGRNDDASHLIVGWIYNNTTNLQVWDKTFTAPLYWWQWEGIPWCIQFSNTEFYSYLRGNPEFRRFLIHLPPEISQGRIPWNIEWDNYWWWDRNVSWDRHWLITTLYPKGSGRTLVSLVDLKAPANKNPKMSFTSKRHSDPYNGMYSFAFSPNNEYLAAGMGKHLIVWNLSDLPYINNQDQAVDFAMVDLGLEQILNKVDSLDSVRGVAYSPQQGANFLVAADNVYWGGLFFAAPLDNQWLGKVSTPFSSITYSLFSANGQYLFTSTCQDGVIAVWSITPKVEWWPAYFDMRSKEVPTVPAATCQTPLTFVGTDLQVEGEHETEDGIVVLFTNGTIGASLQVLKQGQYQISFIGRGSISRGEFPHLSLKVNEKVVHEWNLTETWQEYQVSLPLSQGLVMVDIVFSNDDWNPPAEDRNVWIKSLKVNCVP
ncbi:MAG: hypothetical protein GXO35_05250 [Gammaproteobacteria bacterium]|nr:hypothetical protein [Gammaproteobacteria bacterium]